MLLFKENLKDGYNLRIIKTFEELDKARVSALVSDATSNKKELTKDYFEKCNPKYIIIAEKNGEYAGIMVVKSVDSGFDYLDKFYVAKHLQGNGIGKALWKLLNENSRLFVWRADPDNAINSFYKKVKERAKNISRWSIYGIGVDSVQFCKGIKYAVTLEPTII